MLGQSMLRVLVLAVLSSPFSEGVLLSSWGTESHIHRLAYSTYSLFSRAFGQVTASLPRVYPVTGLTNSFSQDIQNASETVAFEAYNGWFENLELNSLRLGLKGALRRITMTRMHRNQLLQDIASHEIYVCASCMAVRAHGFHYGYTATYKGKEVTGTLNNFARIEYDISFSMNIIQKRENKKSCKATLEQMTLTLLGCDNEESTNIIFNARLSDTDGFSFLADHIDSWMYSHFNSTVRENLQEKLTVGLTKTLSQMDACTEFLVTT